MSISLFVTSFWTRKVILIVKVNNFVLLPTQILIHPHGLVDGRDQTLYIVRKVRTLCLLGTHLNAVFTDLTNCSQQPPEIIVLEEVWSSIIYFVLGDVIISFIDVAKHVNPALQCNNCSCFIHLWLDLLGTG